MLKKRFITALWSLVLLIAAIWFDGPLPWFTIVMAAWGLLAAYEFFKMTSVTAVRSLAGLGLVWTLLFIVSPHFISVSVLPLLLTSAVIISLILVLFLPHPREAFTKWGWTLAGILYIGWLLSYLVGLRLDAGRGWVFLALLATFGSDTGAFFLGKALGSHRLVPHISPGKTWEGAVGGLLGGIILSLLVAAAFGLPISYWEAAVLGLVISIFAQFGDLAESLLKRSTGAKESGNLMPGHGGVLDRLDSVLFAGVAVYYFYIIAV